jgi:hypothetical protein
MSYRSGPTWACPSLFSATHDLDKCRVCRFRFAEWSEVNHPRSRPPNEPWWRRVLRWIKETF